MGEITIRPARPQDIEHISAIIHDPPSQATTNLAGSVAAAIRAGRILTGAGIALTLETTVVAVEGDRFVGIMDAASHHRTRDISPGLAVRILPQLLLAAGPLALVRLVRSRPAWERVDFQRDPAWFYVAELHVEHARRNQGIGRLLLDYGEERARATGCPGMCLVTDITNPARHLYERQGFRVAETRMDAEYERYSGSPGRVFMIKELR